ncbi:MAG: UbiA family prenyltransferase [Chloroflexota bacterium]
MSTLRLVHPFPSFLTSALVFALALLAGGATSLALTLAVGMLGLQFCIGVTNDLFDEAADRSAKPWKPIAAGIVSRPNAWTVAVMAGGGGLALALAAGGAASLVMAAAMLSCGLVYDVRLKRTAWAWLCFSVAFAILPVYAWYGAGGQLPPRSEFVLPLAALAGPLIQLSNALADIEVDAATGVGTLATRLGRRNSLLLIGVLVGLIHGLGWLTLTTSSTAALLPIAGASMLALVGLGFSASERPARRQVGWMIQAAAIAVLGVAWLWVVSAPAG